mmetsp:Transcript_24956/g.80579  ORF Transcript_24956/g.80579 Transcript_24956/m.80579 type:complete len:251 (+) Transcript_24956:1083-1835(+)
MRSNDSGFFASSSVVHSSSSCLTKASTFRIFTICLFSKAFSETAPEAPAPLAGGLAGELAGLAPGSNPGCAGLPTGACPEGALAAGIFAMLLNVVIAGAFTASGIAAEEGGAAAGGLVGADALGVGTALEPTAAPIAPAFSAEAGGLPAGGRGWSSMPGFAGCIPTDLATDGLEAEEEEEGTAPVALPSALAPTPPAASPDSARASDPSPCEAATESAGGPSSLPASSAWSFSNCVACSQTHWLPSPPKL